MFTGNRGILWLVATALAMPIGFGRSAEPPATRVVVDGASAGRLFEGLGALSAGASSRLLREYPEPQRSQILDLLFKPHWGASFQHLKVELGGDVNSTDGTEPSPARTREEIEHPRAEYFDRGYEWWLMREAKRRNPNIYLDILQWGAPAWIGGPGNDRQKFFSQDNADFIVAALRGAQKYHGLDIDFCGIWNETPHDVPWIKLLRKTLNRNGLARVKIVGSDQTGLLPWVIAGEMLADRELSESVEVIGAHYSKSKTTSAALQTAKTLWASEDGPWRGDWAGAAALAKLFNRNYIQGRMTKTIIWSLITSYYDRLPLPNSGPMMAKEPWSGHYEVQPALWAIAHTAQFAQPGWRYLDAACGFLNGEGSFVTLRSTTSAHDYSLVFETIDAKSPQNFAFSVTGGLRLAPLHVWRSNARSQFEQLADLDPREGQFILNLEPGSIYSLTTTTGQHKGEVAAPASSDFPCPYVDDFESYPPGRSPRYFADQGGIFEAVKRPDRKGQCLCQVLTQNGIDWPFHPTPEPYSLIGSARWQNYEVSAEACIEKSGSVSLWGRVVSSPQTAQPARGYWLRVDAGGRWQLNAFTNPIAAGPVAFAADRWHQLKLTFAGPKITAAIDGASLITLEDLKYRAGLAGVGSGWNRVMFDNFAVRPLPGVALIEP